LTSASFVVLVMDKLEVSQIVLFGLQRSTVCWSAVELASGGNAVESDWISFVQKVLLSVYRVEIGSFLPVEQAKIVLSARVLWSFYAEYVENGQMNPLG
jgi:hypothetical protein